MPKQLQRTRAFADTGHAAVGRRGGRNAARINWKQTSEHWRESALAWQEWAERLLRDWRLQPKGGAWGDDVARQRLGDIVQAARASDAFVWSARNYESFPKYFVAAEFKRGKSRLSLARRYGITVLQVDDAIRWAMRSERGRCR